MSLRPHVRGRSLKRTRACWVRLFVGEHSYSWWALRRLRWRPHLSHGRVGCCVHEAADAEGAAV